MKYLMKAAIALFLQAVVLSTAACANSASAADTTVAANMTSVADTSPASDMTPKTNITSEITSEEAAESADSASGGAIHANANDEHSNGAEVLADPEGNSDKNVLVVYFSCTGTTEKIAEYAAAATEGDLFEITPEVPYTPEDLNYGNDSSRSSLEQNDDSARPVISGGVENMEQYGTVFLGYPKLEYGFLCV